MDELPAELTLHSSRLKWLLLLFICLAFIAIGFFLLKSGEDPFISWLCIGFFGLGIPVGLYQMVKPGLLILTPTGFEQRLMGRKLVCEWQDVSEFGTYSIHSGFIKTNTFVSFSRREDEGHALAGIARSLTGQTGQLGDTFGMKAEELADMMNAFRERAIAA